MTDNEAPRVEIDRQALAEWFDPWAWNEGNPVVASVKRARAESLEQADSLIASGAIKIA